MNMPPSQPENHEIDAFLESYAADVRAIALKLRHLVLNVAPSAIEQPDRPARLIGYGFGPGYKELICVIMPLKSAVNLGFPRGTQLPDPQGLLAGTGKRARHVRISTPEEAESPALRALLQASVAQLGDRRT